jgi:type 1 glutamine amidotransferase
MYGQGRVFHTPLGHRDFGPGKDDPIHNPSLRKMVIQGIDWVAEGRKPRSAGTAAAK